MDTFISKCREHNLKITPQRLAIYKALMSTRDHPTADMVLNHLRSDFPHISHDTVNRTLNTFAEIGVIHVVEGYGESKRFDPAIDQHHHFRCRTCNLIFDFHNEDYNNIQVPANLKKNFIVTNHKVVLEGYCRKCGAEK